MTSEENDQELLNVRSTENLKASVGRYIRQTINLGKFESVQLGVEVTLPCHVEELEDAYAMSETFVKQKMEEMLDDLKKELAKKKHGQEEN